MADQTAQPVQIQGNPSNLLGQLLSEKRGTNLVVVTLGSMRASEDAAAREAADNILRYLDKVSDAMPGATDVMQRVLRHGELEAGADDVNLGHAMTTMVNFGGPGVGLASDVTVMQRGATSEVAL